MRTLNRFGGDGATAKQLKITTGENMLIASIDPAEFRTQAIEIEPFAGGINITPVGIPVDFETMQMRRKACQPAFLANTPTWVFQHRST